MAKNPTQKNDETLSFQAKRPLAATQKSVPHSIPVKFSPAPPPHNDQPLSQVANDRLLPEDDIASFFKNRAVASHHDHGVGFATKFLAFLVVSAFIFSFAYNQKPRFAKSVDRTSMKWLGFKIGTYIPVFGVRAKTHAKQMSKELVVEKRVATLDQPLSSDPILTMMRSGRWTLIEQRINGKCMRWEASSDCTYKALYNAHRGMTAAARPMLTVPEKDILKLPSSVQVFWRLAAAMSAVDANTREKYFQNALKIIPTQAIEARKIVFDEMIVGLARINAFGEIPRYLNLLSSETKNPGWRSYSSKWRALAALSYPLNARQAALTALLKEEPSVLFYDAQAISFLTPAIIRGGFSEAFTNVVTDGISYSSRSNADPELQKLLLQSLIRLKLAQGKKAEVATSLNKYINGYGRDSFAQHFNASLQLSADGADRARLIAAEFQSLRPDAPWETSVLYAYALIRSGQFDRIEPILAKLRNKQQIPSALLWSNILRAEKLLAEKKPKDAELTIRNLSTQLPNDSVVNDILAKAYVGIGRDSEAKALQLKVDDVRSKKGYWSSPEMINSPFGPLALSR